MLAHVAFVTLGIAVVGGCGSGSGAATLSQSALMDPLTCQGCHPAQYQDWAGSMHAYATDDPVFRAMNQRAQRESNNALGTFCVNCHAPVAVHEGKTDGTNLDGLAQPLKGVTCYFCHSIESVTGTHNNPLTLASNGSLFGPFADPVPGSPHNVSYSRLLDGATSDSANACGSCHDIQNLQGAHVERTFAEWTTTTLSQTPDGQSCAQCHMLASDGAVSTTTPSKIRRVHSHMFPAVDLAVGDFPAADTSNGIAPQNAAQQAAATAFLATAIQQTLCLNPVTHKLLLTLDNVGASGHSWPSGATPDRRAWVELTATQGGNVIYASGNSEAVGTFPSALPFEGSSPDPDLWLIRDCIYDASGAEVQMFWQAATVGPSNQLPGLLIQNVNDPTTFQTHFMLQYPSTSPLPATPDEVKVTVHLQAIGDDVLGSLVASGDLDESVPPQIARYALGGGATLDWTPTASNAFQATDGVTGAVMTCVATGAYKSNTTPATSHARCPAPAASP
ncbi:MAG TPA: multiheme c-type cytochrome [Polyangia bacterium]|nr:multiheme c-type cytochrome [Polyangia bacterium]